MKKSVIKRRKRVVPAANDPDSALLQQNSFAISPSPQPTHLDTQSLLRPRTGSSIEISPLNSHPKPPILETPSLAQGSAQRPSYPQQGHPQHLDLHEPNMTEEHSNNESGPLGVDFTGYQLRATDGKPPFPPARPQPPHQPSKQLPPVSSLDPEAWTRTSEEDPSRHLSPISHSRKRSHSSTDQSPPAAVLTSVEDVSRPRLSSISQILNNPPNKSTVEEVPIDPHLSTLPPHLQHQRQPTALTPHPQQIASAAIAQGQANRADAVHRAVPVELPSQEYVGKMSRLKREADQMRELLRSKEREIHEMERGH